MRAVVVNPVYTGIHNLNAHRISVLQNRTKVLQALLHQALQQIIVGYHSFRWFTGVKNGKGRKQYTTGNHSFEHAQK